MMKSEVRPGGQMRECAFQRRFDGLMWGSERGSKVGQGKR